METNIKLKEIKINSSIKKYELKTTLLGYASKGLPGKDGKDGKDGTTGKNGATFTPSVDDEGNLSWTNDGDLDNPETKNIKGPKGDKGDKGDTGKGVANGGTVGQLLVKNSDTDGDTSWSNDAIIQLSPNSSTSGQYDLSSVTSGQYYMTEEGRVYWGTIELTTQDDHWKKGTLLFIKTFQDEVLINDTNTLCNCSQVLVANRCSSVVGDTIMENLFCYKEVSGDGIGVVGYNVASVNQLNDAMSQVSETIQSLYDTKQDKLVSGTNIKTINDQNILGEGNITIESGSSLKNVVDGTTTGSARTIGSYDSTGQLLGKYAWGEGLYTLASGQASHAEGVRTFAAGEGAHTEGANTTATGYYSHAEGVGTYATAYYSHVEGKYNIRDFDNLYGHILGNGPNNNERSNAHTIDWSGNAWFAGDVYVGSTSGTNKDAGSVKLATEDMVNESLSSKQDTLVSGSNIKTINNQSILGEGNITIEGGSGGTSDYDQLENRPQINNVTLSGNKTLSDLGINNFDGDYNNLSNKPDIPSALSDLTEDETHRVVTDTEKSNWNNKSSGDTLPIGAIVEYNGTTVPQGYEKVSDGSFLDIYSTSEQIIGKDENGKNVYKRTFSGTTSNTSDSTTVTTDYSGKTIVVKKAYGSIYKLNLGGGVNIGGYVTENFYSGLYLHENSLQIYYGNGCKNASYTLTIEFTKVSE